MLSLHKASGKTTCLVWSVRNECERRKLPEFLMFDPTGFEEGGR